MSNRFTTLGIESQKNALVTLSLVLEECATSLQEGLVGTSTTSDNSNRRAGAASNSLFRTAGQANAGLVIIGGVANDGRVTAGGAGEGATVTDLALDVADDRSLREYRDGENVADSEGGLLAAVHELTGVLALGRDEGLRA